MVNLRVAKVPGAKWKRPDWYNSRMPITDVYLETCFGSGAILFNRRRSKSEIVSDVDSRVVAMFRVLRDRPCDLARVVALTPWSREEWLECRKPCGPDIDDVERARRFLVASHQSHGLRLLTRSGWRHDGPNARGGGGQSVAVEWAGVPDRIMLATERMRGVHVDNRSALDMMRRYRGPRVTILHDPPYPAVTVHGKRDRLYEHDMMDPESHREDLAAALLHPGPFYACSYRNDVYDEMLLGNGWTVEEHDAMAEHGNARSEAFYMNPIAVALRRETGQRDLFGHP